MIRRLQIKDIRKIVNLWKKTKGIGLSEADSEKNLKRFISKNTGLNYVFEVNGKIAGTILCGNDGRRGYLYHVVVDESFRAKGIGKELVQKSLEALKKQGIQKCHLFVFENNELGIGFWKGTGWNKRDDLIVFSKNL
jgi:N-acetylglutamate synthase